MSCWATRSTTSPTPPRREQSAPALNAPTAAIASLYRKIEPLTPNGILDALHNLPAAQHDLLLRCCRYCLTHTRPTSSTPSCGLSDEEAEAEVLSQLAAQPDPEPAPDA